MPLQRNRTVRAGLKPVHTGSPAKFWSIGAGIFCRETHPTCGGKVRDLGTLIKPDAAATPEILVVVQKQGGYDAGGIIDDERRWRRAKGRRPFGLRPNRPLLRQNFQVYYPSMPPSFILASLRFDLQRGSRQVSLERLRVSHGKRRTYGPRVAEYTPGRPGLP